MSWPVGGCRAIEAAGVAASKEGCLNLGAVAGGIREDKASAKAERGASGFQGVAAGGDVIHEIGLAQRGDFAGAGQVVLVGRQNHKTEKSLRPGGGGA